MKKPLNLNGFKKYMVEMGGVEPPSAKPPFKNLHAYLTN